MQALTKKRGVIKSKLTRASKSVDEFLDDKASVRVWLDTITKIELEFEEIQTQIEEISTVPVEGEIDPQETERATVEKTLIALKIKLQQKFDQLTPSAASQPSSTEFNQNPRQPGPRVKLQRLELPMFTGDWREWPTFYQLFNKLIHEDNFYPPIEKFLQLSKHLDGPAKRDLNGVDIIEENYDEFLENLKKKYDNPRLVVSKHLKTLFELPSASNDSQLRPLVDALEQTLRILTAQYSKNELFDAMLVYLIGTRLAQGIRRQWEITHENSRELPTLKDFRKFLEQRATSAEVIAATSTSTSASKPTSTDSKGKKDVKYSHLTTDKAKTASCPICKEAHYAFLCPNYARSTLPDREKLVARFKLCGNCLNPNHEVSKCKSVHCKKCDQLHHTSLHKDSNASSFSGLAANKVATTACLPTACVLVTHQKQQSAVRMLIDSGSQCSFITEGLTRRLHLTRSRISSTLGGIEGVGGVSAALAAYETEFIVTSRHSPYQLTIRARILPVITNYTPQLGDSLLKDLCELRLPLADDFNKDLPIDILLGAEHWANIMQPGKLTLFNDLPPLLNSNFGWLVSGHVHDPPSPLSSNQVCCFAIEDQLRRFWELEDISSVDLPRVKEMTPSEQRCEKHFIKNTTRDENGRYVVKLPFNERISELGKSRHIAERQFLQIERRMERDPNYRENYHSFIREYEDLGHMTQVEPDDNVPHYYVPHHAVIRPDEPSKFRVVFNASQPTSTGVSLNDTVEIGETMQNTLFIILIRFRRHIVAIITDAEKMYRQVLVHPSHRRFQRIKWRYSRHDILRVYELNTVTYGYRSSPHLSVRSVQQLVIDEGAKFTLAALALCFDEYIDDIITGVESIEKARQLIAELQELTARGQFHLRKWASNKPEVLENIKEVAPLKQYSFDHEAQFSKVLGMLWDTEADVFAFHANLPTVEGVLTKRKLLSHLSRIFDPLGLLAPIVIVAKCLLQKLWLQPVCWDSPLDENIQRAYDEYRLSTNTHLHKIRIPRHVDMSPGVTFTLHGFSDASEDAYACCVYINVILDSGNSTSHLLCAKTRVAPIKTVSVPRLELCGAVLLARAMTTIATTYSCALEQRFAYSDSTVVLSWLSKPPREWKTFVSNRVSEINELLPSSQWRHVRSQYNSADIASRGTTADKLVNCTLWWNPPLPPPISSFDSQSSHSRDVLKEQRKTTSLITTTTPAIQSHIINKFSSHTKMLRVFALTCYAVKQFKARQNQSRKRLHKTPLVQRLAMVHTPSVDELDSACNELIRAAQEDAYPDTFRRLREGHPLKKRDPLRPLTPKLNEKTGLLHIHGRLQKAESPANSILLPGKSNFTTTLIREIHRTNAHAGPKIIIPLLQARYWIVNIRDVVRRITYRCVQCRRLNSVPPIQQPTGDLPDCRVTEQQRAFIQVGIDYGGPIQIRFSLARKATSTKAYIALFVCMATKALHLELVSDLTTDAFLAALERFIGRRGRPTHIYSDNGTNFVGAARKLKELEVFLSQSKNHITRSLASRKIQWHFIPPYAPNFGGIWEAGMKSAKRHLVAVMLGRLLTFEEITTILIQVEAALNSRPLTPTTRDQLDALTPGHFLIGAPLLASPLTDASNECFTLQKRWRLIQEAQKAFWAAWKREYLQELQQRAKSNAPTPITIGEIMLIREENTPPLTWPMARVESLHPGNDGVVRVVTVRTATGSTKRAVSKLIRLLIDRA